MNNRHLKTFVCVADAGSFNRGAESLFITPTAVIKQINQLESEVNVRLFERTHRGLQLTAAGKSLYQDARYILQYCADSVTRARNAMQDDINVIRVGSSPMTPAQLLVALWPQIQKKCPDFKFQIVPFENNEENAREILGNLGKNIDVVAGMFDDTLLQVRKCAALELLREPFCCAVSLEHPLAAKDRLSVSDLYGQSLMLMHPGWSACVDELRADLEAHHPEIHITELEVYSMDAFNRCESTMDVLLAIPRWACVHPLLKLIPVQWDYSIPFGLFHASSPSSRVRRFLEAAKLAVPGATPHPRA